MESLVGESVGLLDRESSRGTLEFSPNHRRCATKSTLTQHYCDRSTMICGSNIPNGSSQMASLRCVILTRRASWNCSILRREGDRLGLSLILIASSNRD